MRVRVLHELDVFLEGRIAVPLHLLYARQDGSAPQSRSGKLTPASATQLGVFGARTWSSSAGTKWPMNIPLSPPGFMPLPLAGGEPGARPASEYLATNGGVGDCGRSRGSRRSRSPARPASAIVSGRATGPAPRLQNDSIQWRRHDGEELGSTEVRTPLSLHQGSSLTASRYRPSGDVSRS